MEQGENRVQALVVNFVSEYQSVGLEVHLSS